MKNKLKIFFSAPSLSNKEQRAFYKKIAVILSEKGSISYNWLEDMKDFDPKSWAEKAKRAIISSDIVVAEISNPSTGVGLQIAYANSHRIPVIALVDERIKTQKSVTASMGSGMVTEVFYNLDNLPAKLSEALTNLLKERFVKFNFISTPEINKYLTDQSSVLGMTKSEFLRRIIRNNMDGKENTSINKNR